jgi:hypothetical protein
VFEMTEDDYRDIALSFDGAVEGAHMGHPDFRANGRIFATLHGNDRTGGVMLTPAQQAVYLRDHPAMFTPASGAWGRQGATTVTLATARTPVVRSAMQLAWELAIAKPRPRTRARSKPGETLGRRVSRRSR